MTSVSKHHKRVSPRSVKSGANMDPIILAFTKGELKHILFAAQDEKKNIKE